MTTVEIWRKNGRIVRYESYGHSGYAEAGSDIVCAGVSSLVYAPLGGLQDVLGLRPDYVDRDDLLAVDLTTIPEADYAKRQKEIDALLETMVVMVKNLAGQYPEYLKLVEKEVR